MPGRALCVGLLCVVVTGCGDDEPPAEQAASIASAGGSGCDARMVIYFDPTVPDDEVARVLPSIESIDGVVEAEAVTHEEMYAEFREIFADNSQLIETVTADVLPASIEVRVDEQSSLDEVERYARSLADVQDVFRGEDALSPAIEERMGPDEVARWCSGDD